jgi:hypothetical protein
MVSKELDYRRKVKHVDDFMKLARIYLFDTANPFEFRNAEDEAECRAKFEKLGHTDFAFARCKCRGEKNRRRWLNE